MNERVPITKQGLAKIKEELSHLIRVERPQITKEVAEAREHGDLKENAEYHAAKERQSFIEGRIQEINGRLPLFDVVEPTASPKDHVAFGAKVVVTDIDTDEQKTFTIVGPDEVNTEAMHISYKSPLAQALIGKKEGDMAKISLPKGYMEVEIMTVEY